MSPGLRLVAGILSVALHVGIGVLVVAWSPPDWTQPLFVDLVNPIAPADATRPRSLDGSVADGTPKPVHRGGAALRPTAIAARGSGSAPAQPEEQSAPAPSPDRMSRAVSQDAAAPFESLALSESQVPSRIPPTSATPPTATDSPSAVPSLPSPPGGRSVSSASGAAGPAGGAAPADSSAGPAGSSGSSLALVTPGAEAGGPGPEYGPYLQRFRERVADALVYPLGAQRQGLKGTVELNVRLEASGRVSDVRVVRSSSHEILDEAALETIRRVSPLPFPESLPRRPLLIRIPLVFQLQ